MNAWLERHRTMVLGIVGVAVVGSALAVAIRWQRPAVIEVLPAPPTPTRGPVTIYVSGAVRQPDVYTLPPDALVRDAVEAAGGATQDANLDAINLAAPLFDNQQVRVPATGEIPTPGAEETGPAVAFPINLNTATVEELDALPGIGPALAETIVTYRETYGPFSNKADVQNVPGIGPAKYEAIEELVIAQ
jgi:competence protein ComEA